MENSIASSPIAPTSVETIRISMLTEDISTMPQKKSFMDKIKDKLKG